MAADLRAVDGRVGIVAPYGRPRAVASIAYARGFGDLDYRVSLWRFGCNTCANRVIIGGSPHPVRGAGDWNLGLYFQYTRGGSYSVYRQTGGGDSVELQGWRATPSIRRGNAWNELRVHYYRGSICFLINREIVWNGFDRRPIPGWVGIGAYTDGSGGNRLFADYAVLGIAGGFFPPQAVSASPPRAAEPRKAGTVDMAPED